MIDEEPHFSNIMASVLRIAGFNVVQCYEATGALQLLSINQSFYSDSLMFIDMALEPGSDEELFSIESTDRYMTTGLVLAGELISRKLIHPEKRKNMILYSAHQHGQFWKKIDEFCRQNGTRKWRKRADADISEIFDLANDYV